MEYTIKKLSSIAGVSARTLRYYDQIDLLKPCRINSSGYRIYGRDEVDKLQQILFYKEMGIELANIAQLLDSPDFERKAALEEHLQQLEKKKRCMEILIDTVKKTLLHEEGRIIMTDQEKFKGLKEEMIQNNEVKYGKEIREKYGNKKIEESNRKLMGLTENEFKEMESLSSEILEKLEKAVSEKADPAGDTGKEIAALHKKWLGFTWSSYSADAHAGLADMYVEDSRFTKYYDKNIDGCALFLRDAIKAFIM